MPLNREQEGDALTDIVKAPYSVFYATFRYIYEDDYPAKLNEDVVRGLIRAYSDPDEVVFDPFCGSGVVIKVAHEENRRCVGIDINPRAVELSKRYGDSVYCADSLEVLRTGMFNAYGGMRKGIIDLVVTSPPYGPQNPRGNKNLHKRYSEDPRDLGNMDYTLFRKKLAEFMELLMPYVKPGCFAIVFLKDRIVNKVIQPLSTWLIEDATKYGWILRGRGFIPVQPFMTGGYTPAKMKKRNYPSWIPAQEDILLFQKPPLSEVT